MNPSHDCILLMEDNADDAFLLQLAFRRAQVPNPIVVVRDGEQALDYLAGRGAYADRARWPLPVLALLDLRLPRASGLEVLAWLRSRPVMRRLPVVVLTSGSVPGELDRAYELGANSCLLKPLGFEALQAMVRALAEWWLERNERAELGELAAPLADSSVV
jgi:CheY-like chemotaxis protein